MFQWKIKENYFLLVNFMDGEDICEDDFHILQTDNCSENKKSSYLRLYQNNKYAPNIFDKRINLPNKINWDLIISSGTLYRADELL